MKYLLSWVCRHLEIEDWQNLATIETIVKKISLHVAEVSSYQKITYEDLKIGFAKIIDVAHDICVAQYNNEERIINLPYRADLKNGFLYVVIQYEQNRYRFATMNDFYAEAKNHYLSPIFGDIEENIIFLKSLRKKKDYSIVINSVDIGHRPDLFSHRGLARELAILFDKKMIPEEDIMYELTEKQNVISKKNKSSSLFLNKSDSLFNAAAIKLKFQEIPSLFQYTVLLSPLDITTHSFLIDISNFVLFDIGQPLHVFDGQKIDVLTFQDTVEGKLECLDNTTISIEKGNLVVTTNDTDTPISLVGIIGGRQTGVTFKTKEILIESVAPDKKIIAKAMKLFHKKTESGLRMEKGINSFAPLFACKVFLKIITQYQVINENELLFQVNDFQNSDTEKQQEIIFSHEYGEKIVGMTIDTDFMSSLLKKLGCKIVTHKEKEHKEKQYKVLPPWWRNDLKNADDLTEEIARHIGYEHIPLSPPTLICEGKVKDSFILDLKKYSVSLAEAHEIVSYGISNEEIKNEWQYKATINEIELSNAYTDRQKYMISSHLPSLLDIAKKEGKKGFSSLALFEVAPLWYCEDNQYKEDVYYSFISYDHTKKIDFYFYKNIFEELFLILGYEFTFCSKENSKNKLFHNLYSEIRSGIYFQDTYIGQCGFIDPLLIHKNTKSGSVFFALEINITQLKSIIKEHFIKEHFIKENYLNFDISFFILKKEKIYHYIKQLKIAFGCIAEIKIIDWFESHQWTDKRSVTLRIFVINNNIQSVQNEIRLYLEKRVCKIR